MAKEDKMKPTPLKNKILNWIKDESYDNKAPIIRITDDIKSAVEWLKKELNKIEDNGEGGYGPDCLSPTKTHELINKAFKDIIK